MEEPAASAINWFSEPISKSFASVFDGINSSVESLDLLNKYRNRHFDRLAGQIKHIKVLAMSAPIPLADIYMPARVSTTIHGRLYEQTWISANTRTSPRIRRLQRHGETLEYGDDFVQTHNRVVVLGAPGSGKTTFLKHLALAYSDKNVFDNTRLKTTHFPFYVSLQQFAREISECPTLEDYIVKGIEDYTDEYAADFVRRLLNIGESAVFLDSLDEVPAEKRAKVADCINELSIAFPKSKIVISCRTADYIEQYEAFYEVELARLDFDQIEKIVRAWFASDIGKSEALIEYLHKDESLQSLCETPLLLSLVCIQFHYDLVLPRRRVELYKRCVEAFLRRWDASRGFTRDTDYSSLSDDRKEAMFETIAASYFERGPRYTFPEDQLDEIIGDCCELYDIPRQHAPGILSEVESHHGILERFSAEAFMFSHISFQEYFAARYFVANRLERKVIRNRFKNESWFGVIEFMVSMNRNPAVLFEDLLRRSKIKGIKNFPPLAERLKVINLVYRCLMGGAFLRQSERARYFGHIAEAHYYLVETFGSAGVYPIAVLRTDGVRYAYVYYHRRSTLKAALQPLQMLGNEIRDFPSEHYFQAVDAYLDIDFSTGDRRERIRKASVALCLIIPIAQSKPQAALEILEVIKETEGVGVLSRFVDESIETLEDRS